MLDLMLPTIKGKVLVVFDTKVSAIALNSKGSPTLSCRVSGGSAALHDSYSLGVPVP